MSITKTLFDTLPCGKQIDAYTLTNAKGASLTILTWGGVMQKLMIPDRNGSFKDVVCGFDTIEGYRTGDGYHGALIGRYGNRISKGRFALNGTEYVLNCNENGKGHLHGGNHGYDSKVWDVIEAKESEDADSVTLSLLSPDGEEGYPGNLKINVTYTFTKDTALHIDYQATSDKDTPCNLTSHTYYNMSGYDGDCVMDHLFYMNADTYDSVDELMIPDENAPAPVEGTTFDHRTLAPMKDPMDHNFHLRGETRAYKQACIYADPVSGRKVEVFTDMPAIQIYTACVMNNPVAFKGGVPQRLLHAIAMETQFAPNTPNRPDMPSCTLKAGETFTSRTSYLFGILED